MRWIRTRDSRILLATDDYRLSLPTRMFVKKGYIFNYVRLECYSDWANLRGVYFGAVSHALIELSI